MSASSSAQTRRWQRELGSDLAEVESACHALRAFLESHWAGAGWFGIEVTARECLNNAVLHGNRSDARKKVTLRLVAGRRWLRVEVGDEGEGFNWRKVARRRVPEEEATHGRGIPISFLYAGRVRFNRRGNRITLWFPRMSQEGSEV